jgi:hypothetical protein
MGIMDIIELFTIMALIRTIDHNGHNSPNRNKGEKSVISLPRHPHFEIYHCDLPSAAPSLRDISLWCQICPLWKVHNGNWVDYVHYVHYVHYAHYGKSIMEAVDFWTVRCIRWPNSISGNWLNSQNACNFLAIAIRHQMKLRQIEIKKSREARRRRSSGQHVVRIQIWVVNHLPFYLLNKNFF